MEAVAKTQRACQMVKAQCAKVRRIPTGFMALGSILAVSFPRRCTAQNMPE